MFCIASVVMITVLIRRIDLYHLEIDYWHLCNRKNIIQYNRHKSTSKPNKARNVCIIAFISHWQKDVWRERSWWHVTVLTSNQRMTSGPHGARYWAANHSWHGPHVCRDHINDQHQFTTDILACSSPAYTYAAYIGLHFRLFCISVSDSIKGLECGALLDYQGQNIENQMFIFYRIIFMKFFQLNP